MVAKTAIMLSRTTGAATPIAIFVAVDTLPLALVGGGVAVLGGVALVVVVVVGGPLSGPVTEAGNSVRSSALYLTTIASAYALDWVAVVLPIGVTPSELNSRTLKGCVT